MYTLGVDEKTPGGIGLSLKSKDILKFASVLLGMSKMKVMNTALELYAEKFDIYGACDRFSKSGKILTEHYERLVPEAELGEVPSLKPSRFS